MPHTPVRSFRTPSARLLFCAALLVAALWGGAPTAGSSTSAPSLTAGDHDKGGVGGG